MKVLVLCTWFPYPLNQGSKIRAYHLIRSLAEQHEVGLVSFADTTVHSADVETMERLCSRVVIVPRNPFAGSRLRTMRGWLSLEPAGVFRGYSPEMSVAVQNVARAWRPDRVIALTFVTARYAVAIRGIPRIIDVDNYMSRMLYEAYRGARGAILRIRRCISWWKFQRYEHRLLRQFDLCLAVAPQDREVIARVLGARGAVALVPNGVDAAYHRPRLARPEPNTLVFSGALTYDANHDAAGYFVREIFPLVQAEVPGARLRITGALRAPAPSNVAGNSAVTLTGYLQDVRPTVAGSWASVIPLRVGGGTRLKLLESMALGTPVVSTSKGAEGLDIVPEEHLLIGDTPRAFARQTVRLLSDAELRGELADRARRLVERQYDWTDIGHRFRAEVEQLSTI